MMQLILINNVDLPTILIFPLIMQECSYLCEFNDQKVICTRKQVKF